MNPSPVPPRRCTSHRLRQLARCVGRRYDRSLAACGLKTTQYSLLSTLLHFGPIAPGRLAAAMSMDASTLTRNLQPLLAAGWAASSPGADGRSRVVSVTAAGRAKRAEAKLAWAKAQRDLDRALGSDRVAALHGAIDDCLERLERLDASEQAELA